MAERRGAGSTGLDAAMKSGMNTNDSEEIVISDVKGDQARTNDLPEKTHPVTRKYVSIIA